MPKLLGGYSIRLFPYLRVATLLPHPPTFLTRDSIPRGSKHLKYMVHGQFWEFRVENNFPLDLFSPTVIMATSNNIISFRRHDLDNLRTFLTGLVTIHHTALPYGGVGSWAFKSAAFADHSPFLVGLNVVDQSFFMGLFFWVSGRVSGQSLSKSSPRAFVKSKLLRLGLPIIGYNLTIEPLVRVMMLPSWKLDCIQACLTKYWTNIWAVRGPLWYTATLLIFDIVAALCWSLFKQQVAPKHLSDLYESLSKYGWVVAGACSALARTEFSAGAKVPFIQLQLGYAPQYVYAYILGHLAYQCNEPRMIGPFDSKSASVEKHAQPGPKSSVSRFSNSLSLATALGISLLSLQVVCLPRFLDSPEWLPTTMLQISGRHLPAVLYALWNEFSFVVVGPALMAYFERNHNQPAVSSTWNARYSYAAFLIHTPVSIAMELLVERFLFSNADSRPWRKSLLWQILGPVATAAGVGLSAAWASFFVGKKLVEWVPGLNRII
jgi:glucan biosynthesis protein C